jgi:hypothetical protein
VVTKFDDLDVSISGATYSAFCNIISGPMAREVKERLDKGNIPEGEPLFVNYYAAPADITQPLSPKPTVRLTLSPGDVRFCKGATWPDVAALVRKRLEKR